MVLIPEKLVYTSESDTAVSWCQDTVVEGVSLAFSLTGMANCVV